MDESVFIIWHKVSLAESEKMTRVSFSMSFRPPEPDCVEPKGDDKVTVPRWILLFQKKERLPGEGGSPAFEGSSAEGEGA